jgi:isopentenyl phosphate kinase
MIFLKLGGSLITDKSRPETARLKVMARLAREIAEVRAAQPEMRLLLGHGSGSFGHPEAARHGTRAGARSPEDWIGFQKVWWAAHRLSRHVMDALLQAGLPAVSFPPSGCALCEAGELVELTTEPLIRALEAGLLPVTQGDVAFDRRWGATIVSTEQVMGCLAATLEPRRILLAGMEEGVFARYPSKDHLLAELSRADLERSSIGGSGEVDVTGGMLEKVSWSLRMSEADPELEVRIFSGVTPGNVRRAILGAALGTRIKA